MKHKVVLLLVSFFAVYLTSCLGNNDSYDYTPSGDAQIYYFHLTSDSVSELTDVKFAIDQLSGLIYNPDSMTYGTEIKYKVYCAIQTRGVNSVQVKQTALTDTLALWNGTDSLDFSKPVEFVITPQNGLSKKYYTARVNIHTVKPDSIEWHRVAAGLYPSPGNRIASQAVVAPEGRNEYLVYVAINENEGRYAVQTVPAGDLTRWSDPVEFEFPGNDPENRLPVTVNLEQMIYYDGQFVVAANDGTGRLFRSATGTGDWTTVESAPYIYALLGVVERTERNASYLAAVAQVDGRYVFVRTSDRAVWETGPEVEAGFPVGGGFARISYENMNLAHLLLIGGRNLAGTEYVNAAWNTSDGLHWIEYESVKPPFDEGRVGAVAAAYDDKFYLLGGMNRRGQSTKEIVYSSDKGLSWWPVDTLKMFPENYPARSFSSLHVDKDHYLVIFGGRNSLTSDWFDEVWRGRINRLAFENR